VRALSHQRNAIEQKKKGAEEEMLSHAEAGNFARLCSIARTNLELYKQGSNQELAFDFLTGSKDVQFRASSTQATQVAVWVLLPQSSSFSSLMQFGNSYV
jgi:hypothetical protein